MNKTPWADVAHYYQFSPIQVRCDLGKGKFEDGQIQSVGREGIWAWCRKTYSQNMSFPWNKHTPILRHLEDMTEGEKTQLALMLYCEEVSEVDDRLRLQAYNAVRDQFGGPNLASWRIGFLVMNQLIEWGFNIFGLEWGKEAIRKGVEG